MGYLLLLITNRESHTIFQLVPTSVTLNDLEHWALYEQFCQMFIAGHS